MMASKRLARLEHLLKQMEQGIDVAKRDLKSVLTADEWQEYEERRAAEMENRDLEPPKELQQYLDLKKQATLAQARWTRQRNRPGPKNHTKIKQMYESYDHLAERALECLKEQLSMNRGLLSWLCSEEPFSCVMDAIDASVMPQVITSRTARNSMRSPEGQWSIRELKQDAIDSAIFSIKFTPTDEPITVPSIGVKKKFDFSGFKV
jgi:hypothetical protein